MDIQQKEKESLAAYIHHFKWEASRCKFDNDASTIRIFYKKAKKQLTSTLLPPSSVNIMSSDDDKCFQCQETGNMACYCPHIRCFDCDNYGHVAADCSNKIPPSGIPA